MSKFGYTISKPRFIDFEANDRSLSDFLSEREPSFRLCIECGGCSGSCTAAGFTKFSLRELYVQIRRGETDKIHTTLRKCMLCGKCSLICPRGVNTRNVITLSREYLQNQLKNAV